LGPGRKKFFIILARVECRGTRKKLSSGPFSANPDQRRRGGGARRPRGRTAHHRRPQGRGPGVNVIKLFTAVIYGRKLRILSMEK
jgi:hypothetical protein